ncbi:MAG: hypothetical protein RSG59_07595 [Ruthenibacterium sp.]
METDVLKILQSLADTAANAAEEACTAAQSAKRAVAGKYDTVKLSMELSHLRTQQERLFADIGRTLFVVQSGGVQADAAQPDGKTPQQIIDGLLVEAAQLQHEMSNTALALGEAKNAHVCPQCTHRCAESDTFCPGCGAKL